MHNPRTHGDALDRKAYHASPPLLFRCGSLVATALLAALLAGCATVREIGYVSFTLRFQTVDDQTALPVKCTAVRVHDESNEELLVSRLGDSEFVAERKYKVCRKHRIAVERCPACSMCKPVVFPQQFQVEIGAAGYELFHALLTAQEFQLVPTKDGWTWTGAFRMARAK